jgi:hypothetical protein
LALAASFFIFGTGFLLYLILWIAIPEAKTTAEKLEMRGEPINVDNISKTIKDEFERVNDSARKFASDAKNTGGNFGNRARGMGNNAADFITSLAFNVIRVAGKLFAFIFIFFGIAVLTVVLAALTSDYSTVHIANIDYSFREIMMLLFKNESETSMATIGLFLITAVPLLMLIYKGVRMIFKIKQRNKILSISASVLFLMGICISVYVFAGVAQDFKMPSKQVQRINIATPVRNVLYIKTDLSDKYDFEDDTEEDYRNINRNNNLFKVNDDGVSFSTPQFDVVPSKTDSFELVFMRTARGATKKIAYERASNINYKFSQNDSILNLSNYFELSKTEKWRAQDLKIVLRVPKGKSIYLSKSLKHIIYDIDNVTNTHDSKMMNRKWIMNPEGLTCVDCDGIDSKKSKNSPPEIDNFDEDENE